MSARSVRAGKAYIELFLKDGIGRGFDRIGAKLKSTGRLLTGVGAAISGTAAAVLTPLLALASEFAGFGDTIDKMSARIGVGAESLSALKFAAEQSGGNLKGVERGFAGLSRSIFELGRGSREAVDAFEAIGVTAIDLQGLNPEKQFEKVADGLASIADLSTRGAIAQKIFGRAGRELLPLLANGAKGIQALTAEAKELGLTIDQDGAASAAKLTDAWNRVISTFRGVRLQIGVALADSITSIADRIAVLTVNAINWTKANRDLILTIAKVAVGGVALGTVLAAIGIGIVSLGAVVGSISTVITAVLTGFGGLAAILAALVSPPGLVAVALTGLLAVLLKTTGAGAAALEFLQERFLQLKEVALDAFEGISNALAAGDLQLAAKILWLTLSVLWQEGIQELNVRWQEWKSFFLQVANEATHDLAILFSDSWAEIQNTWFRTVGFLQDGWDLFVTGVRDAWQSVVTFIADKILYVMSLFDESLDRAGAANQLAADAARDSQTRNRERDQRIIAREQERQNQIDSITASAAARRSAIEDARASANLQITDSQQSAIANSKGDLEAARREWEAALKQAAEARKRTATVNTADDIGQRVKDIVTGIQTNVSAAVQRIEGSTLEGGLASRIFGVDAADAASQTAEKNRAANEATASNTAKIAKTIGKQIGVFA